VDKTTQQLVEFAQAFSVDQLTPSVRDAATLRIVDSIACAVVGFGSDAGQVAVQAARGVRSDPSATVFGAGFRTSPELASFANTTMVRAYDWNDGMLAKGGGHPSDMIPAVLAAGQTVHAGGEQVLLGIALAYELLGALGNSAPVRDRGWDQGTFMGCAAALGIAKVLGLSGDVMANAVSLAVVPHMPLRVNRTGQLSMWKGAATASAMHSATFAVRLAQLGMTGPEEPFEGKTGMWEQVTGPFDVSLPANDSGLAVIEISHLKQFPAETHSQALLGVMPAVREWRPVDQIQSIEIEAYWQAYHEIAMHPTRWDPSTRETADHSLPYLLAVMLVDGRIGVRSSFTPERIADQSLRPIMQKISVRENDEFTASFRPPGKGISGNPRMRLTVTDTSGEQFVEEVGFHRGHYRNPMSPDDINAKLDMAAEGVLDDNLRDVIRRAWWTLGEGDDIDKVIETLSDFGMAS
jgi:2-methylcitrate dehydratase